MEKIKLPIRELVLEKGWTLKEVSVCQKGNDFGERGLCPRSPKSLLKYHYQIKEFLEGVSRIVILHNGSYLHALLKSLKF